MMVTRVVFISAAFFGFELMFLSYLLFIYHPNLAAVPSGIFSARSLSGYVESRVENCSRPANLTADKSRTAQLSTVVDKGGPNYWFSTFLLILVPVRPGDIYARQLIRDTWFDGFVNSSEDVELRFAIGNETLSVEKRFELTEENGTFGDIIFIPTAEDVAALTNKTLALMVWAHHHVNFSYYMKTDDDTYVFVKSILVELRKRPTTTRLYFGKILFNNPIVRGNYKWADNDWDLSPVYLPFAMGGGYLLSHDLISILSRNRQHLKWHINEDTAVGAWLSAFDIERRGDNRFCYCYKNHDVKDCRMPYLAILLFGFTREELVKHFNHYHAQVLADVENVTLLTPPTDPPTEAGGETTKAHRVRIRRTRITRTPPTTQPTESTDSTPQSDEPATDKSKTTSGIEKVTLEEPSVQSDNKIAPDKLLR